MKRLQGNAVVRVEMLPPVGVKRYAMVDGVAERRTACVNGAKIKTIKILRNVKRREFKSSLTLLLANHFSGTTL